MNDFLKNTHLDVILAGSIGISLISLFFFETTLLQSLFVGFGTVGIMAVGLMLMGLLVKVTSD